MATKHDIEKSCRAKFTRKESIQKCIEHEESREAGRRLSENPKAKSALEAMRRERNKPLQIGNKKFKNRNELRSFLASHG